MTVSETQGLPQLQTLMNNREGRRSILNPEDMKQLDQAGIMKLETWIFSNEGLLMGRDLKEQIDLQENLKSFFCDFKRLIKNCVNLKKTIKSFFSITSSLDLEQNLGKIMVETSEALSCERVIYPILSSIFSFIKSSLFFVDELNNELIPLKGKKKMMRLPISKGISNYVVNTGKILKIDKAYSDTRFNQEIDKMNHYKTTTILCAPVNDIDGKILGKFLWVFIIFEMDFKRFFRLQIKPLGHLHKMILELLTYYQISWD